jgi:hypothetical protein
MFDGSMEVDRQGVIPQREFVRKSLMPAAQRASFATISYQTVKVSL